MSASQRSVPASMACQLLLVGNGVRLELIRRRDFHVVILLMGLFAAGALAARTVGIEKPSVGTFLLNLGLSLAYYVAHLLTLLLAAAQIPAEIENRTLYPLLAKPVTRLTVLMGKWLACAVSGTALFFVLGAVAWVSAPKLEDYDAVLLLQSASLVPCSLAMMAALAMLGSLVWTRGVTFVAVALLFVVGDRIGGVLERVVPGTLAGLFRWMLAYVPDFSRLNLITRYTDGMGPLSAGVWLGLLAYGGLFTIAMLGLAARLFTRRSL